MSQSLVRLNERLVEDAYGPVAAQIVAVLASRGRLTARELAQFTRLPGSAVLRALVSLVHMRLLLFWTERHARTTWYSVDHAQIYAMLWAGPLLAGRSGAEEQLLRRFCVHGHLTAERAVALGTDTNTNDGAEAVDAAAAQQALDSLVAARALKSLAPAAFWPPADIEEQAVADQFRALAAEKALALSEAARKTQAAAMATEHRTQRHAEKRAAAHPDAGAGTVLAVNYDTFLIAARRAELVALAARHVGAVTAKVYEQVLIVSERGLYDLHQRRVPTTETTVTTTEVARRLGAGAVAELESVFADADGVKREHAGPESATKRLKLLNGGAVRNGSPFGESAANGGDSAAAGAAVVNKHLRLLEEHVGIKFVMRVGDRGNGEWFVPFDEVANDMRRVLFDEVVVDMFSAKASRIVHIVRERGKIDEKTLSQVALVQPREIRHHVNNLHHYGFLDLQEVPRGNDRAPGRNFYFWYHRPAQAYARLVQQLYESMTNRVLELRKLREGHETILTKLNREDVRTKPDEYLTQSEKDELRAFHDAEKQLVATQMIADRYVRVFRDY